MQIKSQAKFTRTAPDKIRILSSLVKGKDIDKAITQLMFSGRAAAKPLILVLKQAKNQAKDKDLKGDLKVVSVQVDEGPKLKRRRIRQQGRATAILKRGSHITIILQDDRNSKHEINKLKQESNMPIQNPKQIQKGKDNQNE